VAQKSRRLHALPEGLPSEQGVVNWVEDGPQFSEEETALVLQGVPLDQLPAATSAKWTKLGLDDEDYDLYPRNLRALLWQYSRA